MFRRARGVVGALCVAFLSLVNPARAFAQCPHPVEIGVNTQGDPRGGPVLSANMEWVRMTLPKWQDVERMDQGPDADPRGHWRDITLIDEHIRQQQRGFSGVRMLAIFGGAPPHEGGNTDGTKPSPNIGEYNEEPCLTLNEHCPNKTGWREYVYKMTIAAAGRIEAFEFWNEPDYNDDDHGPGVGWVGPYDQHPRWGDLLASAVQEIRLAERHLKQYMGIDAHALIVAPAMAGQTNTGSAQSRLYRHIQNGVDSFARQPISSYIDVVSIHARANDDRSSYQLIDDRLNSAIRAMRRQAPSLIGKPLWITEFGYPSMRESGGFCVFNYCFGSGRDDEELQMKRLRRSAEVMAGLHDRGCDEWGQYGIEKAFIYKIVDGGPETNGIWKEGYSAPKKAITEWLRTLPYPATVGGGGAGACAPIVINDQPVNQTIEAGDVFTLRVNAASTAPLTYQWYEGQEEDDSRPLTGQTGAELRIRAGEESKYYWVEVRSGCTSVDSRHALVTVLCTPPRIVQAPEWQTLNRGDNATLVVHAEGAGVLRYEWYEVPVGQGIGGRSPIQSGPENALSLIPSGTRDYVVVVSSPCGRTEARARVTVIGDNELDYSLQTYDNHYIAADATATSSSLGRQHTLMVTDLNGGALNGGDPVYVKGENGGYFSAGADGTITLASSPSPSTTFTMHFVTFGGRIIPGALIQDGLRVAVQAPNGKYWAASRDAAGGPIVAESDAVTSRETFTIGASCKPRIIYQPNSSSIKRGEGVFLGVSADNAATYQWYIGKSGDRSTRLWNVQERVFWAQPGQTTEYWVEVGNACGTVNSHTAVITVKHANPGRRRSVRHDFNRDGRSDVVLREPMTGASYLWLMDRTAPAFAWNLEPADANLQIQGVGDIDNDDNPDLIWRDRNTGQTTAWLMANGMKRVEQPIEVHADPSEQIGAVGDFDNDGEDDLVVRNYATGQTYIRTLESAREDDAYTLPPMPLSWQLAGSEDFNGDSQPDLVWRNRATGENQLWYMDHTRVSATTRIGGDDPTFARVGTNAVIPIEDDLNWSIVGVQDYSGDGKPDLLWLNTDGRTRIDVMNNNVVVSTVAVAPVEPSLTIQGGSGTPEAPETGSGISMPNVVANYGDAITLSAQLLSGGEGVAARTITFRINNVIVGAAQTDGGGFASVTVGGTYNAGSYPISASFAGDTTIPAATRSASLTVNKAAPVLTWPHPASIVSGTPLGAAQLNATASVGGTFGYTPAAGTVLPVGDHTLQAVFTPSNANYAAATLTRILTVRPAAATISWTTPAAISYGTALSAAQLNATADIPGTFVYSPAAGAVLPAGTHTLTTTFTPADPAYTGASASVQLVVRKAAQQITWPQPAPVTYGTALSAAQLNATAAGALTYSPASGTVLPAGTHTLTASAAATDNFEAATATVTLVVDKATPSITWASPAAIVYGTALSSAQLNATANVPGTFAYAPAAGSVLNAGTHTLSATFTPGDTANYTNASATVALVVNKATPSITWANPAAIVYGTALSSAQLNATANVPGRFTYTPVAGTILHAGGHTLDVSFAPDDAANYTAASASVTLVVTRAPQVLAWAQPAAIVYGTRLGAAQLNATVSVPGPAPAGALTYTPPAGTLLNAGTHVLTVNAAETDNYSAATYSVELTVRKADPVLTWPAPAAIVYGSALSAAQLNATADVPGSFAYTPAAGAILNAGTQELRVVFTPADAANYNLAEGRVTLVVEKARQTLAWNNPASIVYGTPLGAAQLNATVSVVGPAPTGAVTYAPAAGTVLDAGDHTLAVSVAETGNYLPATASVPLTVNRAPLHVAVANASKLYGAALPALTGTVTGIRNGDAITASYSTTATVASATGTYVINATLNDPNNRLRNYDVTIVPATLTVLPAPLVVRAVDSMKQYSDALPQFAVAYDGLVLGETPVLGGALVFATEATPLSAPGAYVVSAGGLTSTNYAITFVAGTLTVTREDARAAFTGPALIAPAGQNATSATLLLAATISDISATSDASGDAAAGDIRNATVTFVDRASGAPLCTAALALLSVNDARVATATCTATVDVGTRTSIVAGTIVGGYYTRDAAADEATIAVVRATRDFSTGAGFLIARQSGGRLAADTQSKIHLTIEARNLERAASGAVRLQFERTVSGVVRTYRMTATELQVAAIRADAAGGAADVLALARIEDVTDANAPAVVDPAARLHAALVDGGTADSFAATVWSSDGSLWLSTNWNGVKTSQQLLDGGSMNVHPKK